MPLETMEVASKWNEVVTIGVPVLGLLLLGNILFVKRILKDLDDMKVSIAKLPLQESNLINLAAKVEKLSTDIKDFGQVRERIAVVEYALEIRPNRGRSVET